jgi:hypothetical protein
MTNNTTSAKRDYRQEVTDDIIKMLEQGTPPQALIVGRLQSRTGSKDV